MINGVSTSMVWPTVGSRTATEQNRTGRDRQASGQETGLAQGQAPPTLLSLSAIRAGQTLPLILWDFFSWFDSTFNSVS